MPNDIILHYISKSIFLSKYVKFLNLHDNLVNHYFIIVSESYNYTYFDEYATLNKMEVTTSKLFWDYATQKKISKLSKQAKLIIIHGYFGTPYILYSLFHTGDLKKTIWVVWGHDLQTYQSQKEISQKSANPFRTYAFIIYYELKKYVIRHMKYVIARESEYNLILKSFNPKIQRINVTMLYSGPTIPISIDKIVHPKNKYNILLGHSAYHNEKHLLWIDRLAKFRDNIQLYLIISYGTKEYGKQIAKHAVEVFGNSTTIISEMMEYEEYCQFINTMDVGIIDATEQTGLGCIFTLLSFGKKVYLYPKGINQDIMIKKGYITYSTQDILNSSLKDFVYMPAEVSEHNKSLRDTEKEYEQTIQDWKYIFDEIPKQLKEN